ncbi:glycosyl transferase [Pseudonocardia sp. TRM90224]|uniref:glycosyl transferase n=1 Tax=Pseudonocardia sp. TRM90224 TaxID=2812678 RepID=UPI001E612579|nr:glycosyl transferase [Pseudonocardia sp. TRM90224]
MITTIRPRTRAPGRHVDAMIDAAVVGGFGLAAVVLYGGLWADLDRGYLVASSHDQNLFEWFFAVQAHALVTGGDLLFSDAQNAPLGVNLMANTSVPALAVLLAPVTLLAGPTATWALAMTGGLAGTAAAWYGVLSRHVVTSSRLAAAIGAGFCAFAPPVISHAKAHPNFTVLFVVPLIVRELIVLHRGREVVRPGVRLGLLVALQVFIGEEVLLIAAIALLVLGCGHALADRAQLGPVLQGTAVAALVATPLVAYPLLHQFAGRQSYGSIAFGASGNDVAAFVAQPSQSWSALGGLGTGPSPLALNGTEENAFFGWTLPVLVVVAAIWLWRLPTVRQLVTVIVVMAVLSLGTEIAIGGVDTGLPGPWAVVADLPLLDSVLQTRLGLACVVPVGVLLAITTARVLSLDVGDPLRLVWVGALVAALLPIVPTPFEVEGRPPVPAFIASGAWREYVGPGRTLVPVPLPEPVAAEALHWQAGTGFGFAIPQGYFIGPSGRAGNGRYGVAPRPTAQLVSTVADSGVPAFATVQMRADAFTDLRFWRADVVVLDARHPNAAALAATVNALVGQGRQVSGTWVWDVRAISG